MDTTVKKDMKIIIANAILRASPVRSLYRSLILSILVISIAPLENAFANQVSDSRVADFCRNSLFKSDFEFFFYRLTSHEQMNLMEDCLVAQQEIQKIESLDKLFFSQKYSCSSHNHSERY